MVLGVKDVYLNLKADHKPEPEQSMCPSRLNTDNLLLGKETAQRPQTLLQRTTAERDRCWHRDLQMSVEIAALIALSV